MEVPHQIIDIVKFPGKKYKFALIDPESRSDFCGTPSYIWPGKISREDIMIFREDIELERFICVKINNEDSGETTVWVIWDPDTFDPQSAFKKHRRSQSDQKVSKKRSKNKKTKRSGKKRSTRKTSKRKPRKV